MILLCGSCEKKVEDKSITLTTDNYREFLNVSAGYVMSDETHKSEQNGTVYH